MNTVELFHKSYGEGDPIIVLHGLFGMSDNWATFARQMAPHRMVVLVDMRDHGRSPHTSEFNYELLAEDVAVLMEDNWIHHADVIGHSMGGKAAMMLAHLHPELVDKLVVVDIGPGQNPDRHASIFEAMAAIDTSSVKSRKEVELVFSEHIQDKSIIRFLMKNLSRDKERGFRWKPNLPLLKEKFDNILSRLAIDKIDTPTLFVKGKRSDYLDKSQMDIIAEHFTDYSVHEINEAGHWVHADQPDIFFTTICDFLN